MVLRIEPLPFFRRSGETISRFHEVLRKIISLEAVFLKQPNGDEVPQQILDTKRLYPYLKVNKLINILLYTGYIAK